MQGDENVAPSGFHEQSPADGRAVLTISSVKQPLMESTANKLDHESGSILQAATALGKQTVVRHQSDQIAEITGSAQSESHALFLDAQPAALSEEPAAIPEDVCHPMLADSPLQQIFTEDGPNPRQDLESGPDPGQEPSPMTIENNGGVHIQNSEQPSMEREAILLPSQTSPAIKMGRQPRGKKRKMPDADVQVEDNALRQRLLTALEAFKDDIEDRSYFCE